MSVIDHYKYTYGPVAPQQQATASFEYKAPQPQGTGGGYPRWRSWEQRDHTSRRGKEDVYVPVHRLCAVAWCFDDDRSAADILDSGDLVGVDVHHTLGMPSANIEGCLELRDHGRHSEVTQSQMRAWGEDAKEQADAEPDSRVCGNCGATPDVLCESEGFDGRRCVECASDDCGGEPIEVI